MCIIYKSLRRACCVPHGHSHLDIPVTILFQTITIANGAGGDVCIMKSLPMGKYIAMDLIPLAGQGGCHLSHYGMRREVAFSLPWSIREGAGGEVGGIADW